MYRLILDSIEITDFHSVKTLEPLDVPVDSATLEIASEILDTITAIPNLFESGRSINAQLYYKQHLLVDGPVVGISYDNDNTEGEGGGLYTTITIESATTDFASSMAILPVAGIAGTDTIGSLIRKVQDSFIGEIEFNLAESTQGLVNQSILGKFDLKIGAKVLEYVQKFVELHQGTVTNNTANEIILYSAEPDDEVGEFNETEMLNWKIVINDANRYARTRAYYRGTTPADAAHQSEITDAQFVESGRTKYNVVEVPLFLTPDANGNNSSADEWLRRSYARRVAHGLAIVCGHPDATDRAGNLWRKGRQYTVSIPSRNLIRRMVLVRVERTYSPREGAGHVVNLKFVPSEGYLRYGADVTSISIPNE